jgi:hypothetical protein
MDADELEAFIQMDLLFQEMGIWEALGIDDVE